eukprot:756348-Hanusia_phi.AAC.3
MKDDEGMKMVEVVAGKRWRRSRGVEGRASAGGGGDLPAGGELDPDTGESTELNGEGARGKASNVGELREAAESVTAPAED